MNSHLAAALAEFSDGSMSLAIKFSEYALACDPDDARALSVLGRAQLKMGSYDLGIDALEQASLLCPLDDESSVELAIAYGCIGHRSLSRDLLMSIATSGDLTAQTLLRVAAGLEAIDEPRLAMEACRQAGRKNPDLSEVHYQMGHYAQACGHPPRIGEALIRHAIGLDPKNVHYRIGLASLLIRLGRQAEAVAVVDRFIPDHLGDVDCKCCLKRIANLFFDCDDHERAKLCAERLASISDHENDQGATHHVSVS
ncbi:MAG: hypothetical protein AAF989_14920 [Planctomycetota bacterium]